MVDSLAIPMAALLPGGGATTPKIALETGGSPRPQWKVRDWITRLVNKVRLYTCEGLQATMC